MPVGEDKVGIDTECSAVHPLSGQLDGQFAHSRGQRDQLLQSLDQAGHPANRDGQVCVIQKRFGLRYLVGSIEELRCAVNQERLAVRLCWSIR